MKKVLSFVVFGCLLSNIYCSPTNILASGGATMVVADGERSMGQW